MNGMGVVSLHLHFDGPTTATTSSVLPATTSPSLVPRSGTTGAMLRYCPSLDFSPSTVLPQSKALVSHRLDFLAEHTTAHGSDNGPNHAQELTQKKPNLHSRLQSLVRIAREANASMQAASSLESFLQQVRDQQKTMEVAFEERTAAATAAFMDNLSAEASQDPDSASESSHDSCTGSSSEQSQNNHKSNSSDASDETHQGAERSNMLSLPLPKRVATFRARERLRTIQQREEITTVYENVVKIRKEIQKAYRDFARTTGRVDEAYRLELVLRALLPPSSSARSQQLVLRRKLQPRLEIFEDSNLGVLNFRAHGGLTQSIERQLREVASSTRTGGLYSVEVLLHPCATVLTAANDLCKTQVPFEQQRGRDNKTQHSPADLKRVAHFTDAETQTPHNPAIQQHHESSAAKDVGSNNICKTCKSNMYNTLLTDEVRVHLPSTGVASPTKPEPVVLYEPLKLSPPGDESRCPETAPMAREEASDDDEAQYLSNSHGIGEQESGDVIKELPKLKEHAPQISVKETVTRIMACKKAQKANDGPDHFLSLLDLVRKK